MQHCGRHMMLLVALIFCLLVLPTSLFSAATGKIIGTVIDKDSKEPVIGASVQVMGTTLGSGTDMEGRYAIGQVEPGTHTLKVSHVRYREVEVTDVEVKCDLNTEVNVKLEEKVTELGKIVVRAERDVIDRREVSAVVTITSEQIDVQPVSTVQDLLKQVTGVVTGREGEIFIRGGRAGEVSYILDGVPIDDPLAGVGQAGASLSLVSGSIQEFTVIKDGFDHEYGDAVSGIIKITTRTGSKDTTRMNMYFLNDDFGNND